MGEKPTMTDGVKLTRIFIWIWECPYCEHLNREVHPQNLTVTCQNCGDDFKVAKVFDR